VRRHRAGAQVVAIGEAAGQHDQVELGQIGLAVPDHLRARVPVIALEGDRRHVASRLLREDERRRISWAAACAREFAPHQLSNW
jgi:hypothetical protein